MKKVKMIAIDMDGTLLNKQKKISPYTKEVLERAMGEGVYVVAATGRSIHTMPEPFMELEGVKYAICSNGACVMDIEKKEALYRDLIPKESISSILEVLYKYNSYREAFCDGWGYADKSQYEIIKKYFPSHVAPIILESRIFVDDLKKYIEEKKVDCDKLHIMFTDIEEREMVVEEIKKLGAYELDSAMMRSIELTAPGVCKGSGIIKLGNYLGIDKDEIMAIGDAMNDASMLREAGYSVAMENALPEIKEIAKFITDTNDNDGVGKAVAKNLWPNE